MKSKNINILLIEDSIADAELLRMFLSNAKDMSFSLQLAERLSKGLADLQERSFDVVLVDLNLPDSQGIETALTVRKHSERVPIIVLTGFDDEDLATKALQMDIQDYLIKGQINSILLTRSIRYAIERKRAVEELQNSEARFRAFFESAGVGAIQVNPAEGRYILVNDRFCEITGYTREELLTMTFRDITHPDDHASGMINFTRLINAELPDYEVEKRYIRKDGQSVWVHVSVTVVRDAYGKPIRAAGVVQDITARKEAEERIQHLADHDELTGLPNRRLICDLIHFNLVQARRNKTKFAIFFLDLDRFKQINDTLGHEAGDEALKAAGVRLRSIIRESDIIARVGGDEFIILLSDVAHVDAISEVARKIMDSFRSPLMIGAHKIVVTPSIGISMYPDDGEDINSLLRNADIAMYQAKQRDGNKYLFYRFVTDLHTEGRRNLTWPSKSGTA
jgi:diguanylate cyclase (GGDEF)-like protein/PAS domain S-box-containing protein